mmetsp:Transcript_14645/g.21641  ORF Transcript_14645/g.21641 Transcript_14645/m.21641 type:complete len:231 (-) Transcript_14645:440-1132(-)
MNIACTKIPQLVELLDTGVAPEPNVISAQEDASRPEFIVGKTDFTVKPIYFDALPYKGEATKVFAWIGLPNNATGDKIPAMVLVHGGGGTAFFEWVRRWNLFGYAAIAIAVEGQTDISTRATQPEFGWATHGNPGPRRTIKPYGDWEDPLRDQWMFHAVADTILAHNLMRSYDFVDPAHIGLMGVSWGGVISATTVGIDNRFSFLISCYGCGFLKNAPNYFGRGLLRNQS